MSNDIEKKALSLSEDQIVNYFHPKGYGMIIFLILATVGLYFVETTYAIGAGFLTVFAMSRRSKHKGATDAQIDAQWKEIAHQREDEAYRVAHMDKEDVIRDAEYFWAYPEEVQKDIEFTEIEGDDKFYRRNYQRLVYMIYGKDQLVVFDENICIENNWDGLDNVQEYYWKDVSSIGFDQKKNILEIVCGPKHLEFPLQGDPKKGEEVDTLISTEAAENLSNSVRVILRERKTS